MEFSLDQRTAKLGVGEFAGFMVGPQESGDGPQGIWRAQLGTHWHQQLRAQAISEGANAQFEVSIAGQVFHRGWTLSLNGRIDQLISDGDRPVLREIKTVTRALPTEEDELRREYPSYFAQLGAYVALTELTSPTGRPQAELVFVEAGSGLAQTVRFSAADENAYRVQLERMVEFLELRLRARERLRALRFKPAFSQLRAGQETVRGELSSALREHPLVLFEAPTGFGKTGAILEVALEQLHEGRFERVIYLTSKSTGQLQVAQTLARMTALENGGSGVAVWQVRNKREHCVNRVFRCVREHCSFLADIESKWNKGGLARFYLFDNERRDIEALRSAGRAASVCPYEITRVALPFNDVWIGDYNYVFAPSARGIFFEQAGFDPARTLLVVDEAHNLPSRVADVYSHTLSADRALLVSSEFQRTRQSSRLVASWGHWTHFLQQLRVCDALTADEEDDARNLLDTLAPLIANTPLDTSDLGPEALEDIWQISTVVDQLINVDVPRLWWSAAPGQLSLTCLDAATAIGSTLRAFGGTILASATLTPLDNFAAATGLDAAPDELPLPPKTEAPERLGRLNKRETRRVYAQLTSAADLLKIEEVKSSHAPFLVRAHAPWRTHAYDIAVDLRIDTSYQQRERHYPTTAATIAALCAASGHEGTTRRAVAVFFPSYRYAEAITDLLRTAQPSLRVAMQPRVADLAAQTSWVEQSLPAADALFLVLGSSFAEGIDLLGGRVSHALVVGPALPEVNPVQKARLGELSRLGRDESFRRVYQAPGIQKVNQALGRLVRAPGQRARVVLHCRRFAENSYAALLAPEYQGGFKLTSDADFETWLQRSPTPEPSPGESATPEAS